MMKKIIALALALSMALSMVAFAGYTDADLINEDLTADIDLVKALGIMTGNPDGSFNPKGTLTRGEAAVIVYRLSAGKKDIDASWGDASLNSFTDMAGHWSAPYVNYCAALGLILGDPAGTFRPNDAVTAVEMAKMLLNAAGYDTEKQQYGPKWPAAVLADATNAGLFADFEAAYTAPASREWVAKLVANLILGVKTVGYHTVTDKLEVGEKTFGTEKYGVKSVPMYALANEKAGILAASAEDYSKVGAALSTGEDADVTIKYVIPTELLGHKITVYFKEGTTGETGLTSDDKIYGVFDAAETVIETAMDKIYVHSTNGLMVNGKVVDEDTTALFAGYENLSTSGNLPVNRGTSASYEADGRAVELVYQDDAWYAFYNAVTYTKVTENDAEDTTFTTVTNVCDTTDEDEYAAIIFNDEVAEDDYVAIEKLKDNTFAVSKVNVLRTTVSSYSDANGTKTFKIGSTTYKESVDKVAGFDWEDDLCDLLDVESGLEETYDIYAVGNYVVFAEAYTASFSGLNTNIAFVIDTYEGQGNTTFTNDTDKVQVMFSDGSIGIYEYEVPEDVSGVTLSSSIEGKVYEYKLDGAAMYFTQLASAGTNDKAIIKDTESTFSASIDDKAVGKSYLTVDGAVAYANADTFFFVVLEGANSTFKYEVIKASELVGKDMANYNFTTTAAYIKDTDTGLNTLAYGVLKNTNTSADEPTLPGVSAAAGDYFITVGAPTKVVTSDSTVWTVSGVNAEGKKVTLTLNNVSVYNAAGTGILNTTTETTTGSVDSDANGYVDKTVARGNIYEVLTKGEKTYLKAFAAAPSAELAEGWNKVLITAATKSSVILSEVVDDQDGTYSLGDSALYDLADDVVITYVYGSSLSQKTSNLPTAIPFVKLIEDGTATTTQRQVTIGETKYDLYTDTNSGTEIIKYANGYWYKKGEGENWAADNLILTGCSDASAKTAVTDTTYSDANIYSYVRIDEDGVVTDIIIKVTSSSNNTQVSNNVPFVR